MIRRNTIQKEAVLKAVRALRGHVTADDVYSEVTKEHPSIGRGTVYRNLNLLSDEGEIRRVQVPDGADCFDFTLTDHYHIVCTQCKKVSDLDMEVIPDMISRVRDTHGMRILAYDLLFKGICKDCLERNEAENG